ncbi:hypothetical protein HMPREF9510_02090 [Enterococcus faecalis TX0470]|nr:hypothetical protein HMPREF9510_02090 [Enterococcus faecalis TX0470]
MSIVDFSIFLKLFPQAIVQCGKKVHKGEKSFPQGVDTCGRKWFLNKLSTKS